MTAAVEQSIKVLGSQLPGLTDEDSGPMLRRVLEIASEAADLRDTYKQRSAALKVAMIEAVRKLSEIDSRTDLLRIARFCNEHREALGVRQSDLAFAILGNENHTRRFRQLLADPEAPCTKCGELTHVGSQFESAEILCDRCRAIRRAEWATRDSESDERSAQYIARLRAGRIRIRVLRGRALLTQNEAQELSKLVERERDHMHSIAGYSVEELTRYTGYPPDLLCRMEDC